MQTSYIEHFKQIFEKARNDADYILNPDQINGLKTDVNNILDILDDIVNNSTPNKLPIIEYSKISKIIYLFDEDTSKTLLSDIIEGIRNVNYNHNNDKVRNLYDKLIEHTELAIIQKESLEGSNKEMILKLKGKTEELEEIIIEYEKRLKKSTMDIIAIIGIFSTIIFAVFGGINQIGAIGSKLPETPIYKIFIYTGISGATVLSIVFLSFYSLSKLTKLSILSCKCDGDNCKHSIVEKHPVFSFSLWMFISFIAMGLIILILKLKHNIILIENVYLRSSFMLILITFLVSLPIYYIILKKR